MQMNDANFKSIIQVKIVYICIVQHSGIRCSLFTLNTSGQSDLKMPGRDTYNSMHSHSEAKQRIVQRESEFNRSNCAIVPQLCSM